MSNATFRLASDKQVNLINKLLVEKDMSDDQRMTIVFDMEQGLSTKGASQWIDIMFRFPRAKAPVLDLAVDARPLASEVGFYQGTDGVYKVVETRDGQRLYAKKSTPSGWDFESGRGMMRKLFADQKLTGEQLAALGITFGFCVVCSSGFEDPTSKHIGIGPTCGTNELGKDAYKALRLTVADKPDVIAYEAAKKAKAKEAREAKKAAEAQLVLV